MRVSIKKNDSCYVQDTSTYTIFFNRKVHQYVITADEEEGYIEAYCLDDGGNVIVIDGRAKTEKLLGRVKILKNNR